MRTICIGPRCMKRPVMIFCKTCWENVPGELRERIADTWPGKDGPYSEGHKLATLAAVRALERIATLD